MYADPVRLADDTLNGILCFRLHVKRSAKPSTVWIGQDTYLIRRIDSGSKFSDFRTEDTTVYEPIVDIEVDDAELAFGTPPAKGGLTKS